MPHSLPLYLYPLTHPPTHSPIYSLTHRALTAHRRRVLNEYIYNRIQHQRTSTKTSSQGDLRSVGGSTFIRSHRRAYSTSTDNDIDMDFRRIGSECHRTGRSNATVRRSKSWQTKRTNGVKHMSSVEEKVQLQIY